MRGCNHRFEAGSLPSQGEGQIRVRSPRCVRITYTYSDTVARGASLSLCLFVFSLLFLCQLIVFGSHCRQWRRRGLTGFGERGGH